MFPNYWSQDFTNGGQGNKSDIQRPYARMGLKRAHADVNEATLIFKLTHLEMAVSLCSGYESNEKFPPTFTA